MKQASRGDGGFVGAQCSGANVRDPGPAGVLDATPGEQTRYGAPHEEDAARVAPAACGGVVCAADAGTPSAVDCRDRGLTHEGHGRSADAPCPLEGRRRRGDQWWALSRAWAWALG